MDVTDDRTRSDSGSTATTSVFGSPESSQSQQLSLFDKLHATFDINEELPVPIDGYRQTADGLNTMKVQDNYDDSSSSSSFEGFRMN
jgi:hypothetical protein